MNKKKILLLLFLFSSIFYCQNKVKDNSTLIKKYKGQSVYDITKVKENNIDIGLWALIIAKEHDNNIDVEKYLKTLDSMTEEIKKMLAGREKDMDKFLATKMFLFEAGQWNNFNSFSYDLEDPLGYILEHQLLSNYIDSRKGNCVSMPTLFLVLMERVDPSIKFVGVKAPLHLFCRLKDRQTNDVWNVETTNGGIPTRNQWYIDRMQISKTALDNKIYLQDLSKKEFIAELIGTLVSKERRNGNFEKAMEYTDLILKLSPKSDIGLVNKGALYAEIGYQKSQEKELTIEEKEYYKNEANKYIEKAISLGWQSENGEQREKYLQSVKTEKDKK